jgi:hypothetical protein
MSNQINISFKPKAVVKQLLSVPNERNQDVLIRRYGLGSDPTRMTLEAIGDLYGITRERVRQIENTALQSIRKSQAYREAESIFAELRTVMVKMGGIVHEKDFLNAITTDHAMQQHVHFLLVVGDLFVKHKESDEFEHSWTVDKDLADRIHDSLQKLYASLGDDELIEEKVLVDRFLSHLKEVNAEYANEEIYRRWLGLSRRLSKNPLNEWGRAQSPNVSARGIRDYAFLVLRKHGSPMHFREVAQSIELHFKREAHIATTHNELIKDKRFVLVGRGLYALSEWGYSTGIVRDVIREVLQKHGPMHRDEIVDKVMRERYVKENTVVVNLQNIKFFKKNKEGKYESTK